MSKSQDSHNMKKRKLRNIFLFFFLILPLVLLFITYDPRLIAVASSSMEPSLTTGDLAAVRKVAPDEIRVGDVIAYSKLLPYSSVQVIVHRVVEVNAGGGFYVFKTKGDANPQMDPWDVSYSEIIGVVFGVIPKAGFLLYFVRMNLVGITLLSVGLGLILLYAHQGMKLSQVEASTPVVEKPSHLVHSTPSISASHQWSVSSPLPKRSNTILPRSSPPHPVQPAPKTGSTHIPQPKTPAFSPQNQRRAPPLHHEVSTPRQSGPSRHSQSLSRAPQNQGPPTSVTIPASSRETASRNISVHDSETTVKTSKTSHIERAKTIPLMMLVLENKSSLDSTKPFPHRKSRVRIPHATKTPTSMQSGRPRKPRRQAKPTMLKPELPTVPTRRSKAPMKPANYPIRVKIQKETARPSISPKRPLIPTPSIEENEAEEIFKPTVARTGKRRHAKTARKDKSASRLITYSRRRRATKAHIQREKSPSYPTAQRSPKRLQLSKRSKTRRVLAHLSRRLPSK